MPDEIIHIAVPPYVPPDPIKRGREIAYHRMECMGKIFPNQPVSKCLRMVIPGKENVDLFYNSETKVGSMKNIFTCNNLWLCPICARKRAYERRAQLIKGLSSWPGGYFMYHLTMRHNKGQPLSDLYDMMNDAYHLFKGGKANQTLKTKYKIIGSITSRELTYGDNGWHPHIHSLMVTENIIEWEDRAQLSVSIPARWVNCVKSVGGEALTEQSAVTFPDIENDAKNSIDYPIKWGIEEELTLGVEKSGRKHGLTMFQMAEQCIDRERPHFRPLLYEYFSVYKGKRQLRYDKGLRELLKIDDVEDGEIEYFDDFEKYMEVPKWVYDKIVAAGRLKEFYVLAVSGQREVIDNFIRSIYGIAV